MSKLQTRTPLSCKIQSLSRLCGTEYFTPNILLQTSKVKGNLVKMKISFAITSKLRFIKASVYWFEAYNNLTLHITGKGISTIPHSSADFLFFFPHSVERTTLSRENIVLISSKDRDKAISLIRAPSLIIYFFQENWKRDLNSLQYGPYKLISLSLFFFF